MSGLLYSMGLRSRQRKRQSICDHLNAIGVAARMAEKDRPEELFRGGQEYSIGLIYVQGRQLEWVNVVQGNYRQRLSRDLLFFRSFGQPFYYRIWYGFHDPNLKIDMPSIRFHSSRSRSMKIIGRAVDVVWENNLEPVDVPELSGDGEIRRRLIETGVDMEVMAFPDGYWIISNREAGRPPSKGIWDCYEAVAEGLKRSSKGLDPSKL